MGARRAIGPAAIAAALIGAGLMLYRPGGVPQLLPGGRIPAPASLASAISWSAPSLLVPPTADSSDSALLTGKATSAQDAAAALERAALRDAPADFPYATSSARAGSSSPAPGPGLRRPNREKKAPPASVATAPAASAPKKIPGAPPRAASASSPAAVSAKRTLLSKGPAPAEGELDEEFAEQTAVDVAGGGARRRALDSRRRAAFPLFRPPKRSDAFKKAAARRRRPRPPLLSKMLGRGALRPPPSTLKPPDLAGLNGKRPTSSPEGAAVPTRAPDPLRLETLDPRKAGAAPDRRQKPHWDGGLLWHDGEARGVIDDARWLWLWTKGSRWWAAPEPDGPPLLHHHGLWWSKRRGVWFVQHEGEPWTWRRLAEWDAQGLVRLRDGVQLLYSADFTKVAVLTPGEGAVLYDAVTGEELGQWLESELPRRRPRPPADLRLPRGI